MQIIVGIIFCYFLLFRPYGGSWKYKKNYSSEWEVVHEDG